MILNHDLEQIGVYQGKLKNLLCESDVVNKDLLPEDMRTAVIDDGLWVQSNLARQKCQDALKGKQVTQELLEETIDVNTKLEIQ